jgi:TonB family protein
MRKTFVLLCTLCILFSLTSSAQKVIKYYDKDWSETSPGKALYYAEFIKEGSVYKCTSYYTASNAVRGRSTFADTLMINPIGLQTLYNKKGRIEDSIYYSEGKTTLLYHYHPNGKLAVHYYLPDSKKEPITEAYDEEGNKLKNFIVIKDAEPKGGLKGWEAYLKKNMGKDLEIKDEKLTTATVQVQFFVDENGGVTKAKLLKSSGNKEIDKDALRVISESPEWRPAITFNNPVKVLKIQSFTYNLQPAKKSK